MLDLDPDFSSRLPPAASFEWFMRLKGDVFRDLPDRKTLRFELGGKGYFIKMHTGVGWREIFKNLFQGKLPVIGAKNEYLAIKQLDRLGIKTMRLVGYGSQGLNPARRRSFVITEEISDAASLEDICATWSATPPDPGFKRALIRAVAKTAKALHENGMNHRDFYICHFLLKRSEKGAAVPNLFLIDLHRVQLRNKTPRRWVVKDLAAVYFSSMSIGLTSRDRLRFIRAYRGGALRETLTNEASFWGEVARKAERLFRSPSPG